MAASPARSTNSSVAIGVDLQDSEVFSDDSGVDVRLQKTDTPGVLNLSLPENRRNKRKSSEPKRRKDVLQMKRFRWDTDEENDNVTEVTEKDAPSDSETEDPFDDGERPSSGDSGCCQLELVGQCDKKRGKNVAKSSLDSSPLDFAKPGVPLTPSHSHRQSVIKKRDVPSAIPTNQTQLESKSTIINELLQKRVSSRTVVPSSTIVRSPDDFDLRSDDGDQTSEGTSGMLEPPRSVGRPRNYKSMSRQRRIEANARERTRVHTISAAFESLRRAVPAYAHNQKLSKLAILRIASAYIVALACLNNQDYSQEQNKPSLAECVEQCTRTIQAEGRSRRRTRE